MSTVKAKYEEERHNLVAKDFAGINTQSSREAIDKKEFAWLENLIPIGPANIQSVAAPGASFYTVPASTITSIQGFSLNGNDYLIFVTAAGGVRYYNITGATSGVVFADGTFSPDVDCAQWQNTYLLFVATTGGYWSWDGTSTVNISASSGYSIDTYSGRVWIAKNRTVLFSAPNSYTDFTTIDGGGSFVITDQTLHNKINYIYATNNYLYIFGNDSVNIISDVQILPSTTTTVYSNTLVTSNVGTPFPNSITQYLRSIAFAHPTGFYVLTGTTPQKISGRIDGTFNAINQANPITACSGNINGQNCLTFSVNYNDPYTGTARNVMLCFFDGKWFACYQNGVKLTTQTSVAGQPTFYGTDGTNVYQLFSSPTTPLATTLRTALWSMDDPIKDKQSLRYGVEVYTGSTGYSGTISVDSTNAASSTTNQAAVTLNWVSNTGAPIYFTGSTPNPINWTVSGFIKLYGFVSVWDKYLGYTITSSSPSIQYNGLLMEYRLRKRW
jgi:hypothetical protein